jgi:hypothetical protein
LRGPPWTDGGAYRRHRSVAARSPKPGRTSGHSRARELIGGGTTERERNTGNSARASSGLGRRCGDGRETAEERKFGNSGARASKEGESEMGEVR